MWTIQCQKALIREGLWRIDTGEETIPTRGGESELAKFASRMDREGLWRIDTGEETISTRGGESELAKFASRKDQALASIVLTFLLEVVRVS